MMKIGRYLITTGVHDCLQILTSFPLTRSKLLVRVVGRSSFDPAFFRPGSNPLLTDEFATRFSAGVDTRISFKL